MSSTKRKRARRRSWGSITTVNRNKHILRWVENTPDGRKRKSRTLHCTYREACQELHKLELAHANDRPAPTIGDAYNIWYLPWLKRRVNEGATKEKTYMLYTQLWSNIICPRWGNVPITHTPPLEIQKWLLTLTASNAKIALTVLKKVCDFAVQYEVIESNKFRMPYELPLWQVRAKGGKTYTLPQANKVFESMQGRICEAPFILACFGSARVGESLGVRVDEIHFTRSHGLEFALVPINRRMYGGESLPRPDGDLKTAQSRRTLIIPPPYNTRLAAIVETRKRDGSIWLADCGDGMPIKQGNFNYLWKKDVGNIAIPPSNLRASWRTFAAYEWGIDSDTLEILMGHKIPTVTGRHYLKPTVDNLLDSFASAYASFHVGDEQLA